VGDSPTEGAAGEELAAAGLPTSETPAPDQGTPLAYRVVRGGLWVAASSYFNVGFGFAAGLVLVRILTPEHFGIFALAGFFFSLINLRPKIGVGQAFAQRETITGDLVGTHLTMDVSAGLATLALAAVALPILPAIGYSLDLAWVLLALAGVGVSDSLMTTAAVLLDKELQFGRSSLVSSIVFPFSYAPAIWLALQGAGYWSLVAQSATYSACLLLAMWLVARSQLPLVFRLRWTFNFRTAKDLLRFGAVVGFAGMAALLVTQFDNFLVGTFVGVAILGFYDRAYRIAQWPSTLVSAVVSRSAFFTYVRLQNDSERLQKTVTMTLWLITMGALPLALGIFAAAPDLIRLLYGERWLSSAIFVRFLVVYSVLRPLGEDAGSLFVAVGRPRLTLFVALVQAATLVVLGTVLTLLFGAVGTCVAVGVTFVCGIVLAYVNVVKVVALRIWSSLGYPAVASLIALASYALLVRVVDMDPWVLPVQVLCKVLFTTVLYFALMLALQPRNTVERATYVWRLALGRG
jgi:lipopolysaccharide exporter